MITFPFTGVYQVSITGTEQDTNVHWTVYRLHGISSAITCGLSNAFVIAEETGEATNYAASFLAQIEDVDEPYTIQMRRNTQTLTLNDVADINGEVYPPTMVATIEYLG